jgi:hypothetical protein
MSPASEGEPDWMETAWQYVLRLDQVLWDGSDPAWLDYPAMMKIPVSSPAVLGRLKGFCKPYDFVLAPLLLNDKLDPEERAEKPILITRFTKHANEWLDATYYNVRTCDKCRITVGKPRKGLIPVKSYRQILNQYLYHPEYKFATTQNTSSPDRMADPVIPGLGAYCNAAISPLSPLIIAGRNSNGSWNKARSIMTSTSSVRYARTDGSRPTPRPSGNWLDFPSVK